MTVTSSTNRVSYTGTGTTGPFAFGFRVLAATDCGFDTSAGIGRVTEDVVWAKLRALKQGAQLASQRLFPRGRPQASEIA